MIDRYDVPYISNPVLEDKVIDTLRKQIANNVGWVQYVLPAVYRKKDNKGIEFPFYRMQDGSNNEQMLSPDSALESIIFFTITPQKFGNGEASMYDVSLYCWFQQKKIDAVDYDITNNLMAEVIGLLYKTNKVQDIKRQTTFDEVWNFAGFQQNEKQMKEMMGKYSGFRLDFVFGQQECYQTYTVTTGQGC